jgi:O-antigen/teichoic acid export membrane protein
LEWQFDVVLLSFFTDERQVGLYGVAQAILSVLMLLLYSVDTVVYPLMSRSVVQTRSSVGKVHHRLVTAIAVGTIPFAFLFSLSLGLIIPRILGNEFVPALVPLYWLIATWVIHFLNVPNARLIISLGQQRYVAMFVALSVVLSTLLNVLLIPSQGIRAPAMARTVSATTYTLLCTGVVLWLLTNKKHKITDKIKQYYQRIIAFGRRVK